ncbi:MAG: CcmD family protein [Bacteroidetes bacterium]|nr:CcmD family protein [Bacteroidota bacterium]
MNKLKHIFLFAFLLMGLSSWTQGAGEVEMADSMYQSGKIYVVVTVLAIIFVGILVYLIMLDRKIRKIEKELKNKE